MTKVTHLHAMSADEAIEIFEDSMSYYTAEPQVGGETDKVEGPIVEYYAAA